MSANTKYDKRLRSFTDPDATRSSYGEIPAYRTRLYHLFELIEKEFDTLHVENTALRSKLAALTGENTETSTVMAQECSAIVDTPKNRKTSAMMGQKLRTASRLVFKVAGDDSRFKAYREFEGHTDGIWDITTDSEKNMCGSSSSDQTAKIWSIDSGKCLATYSGHSGSVNCVAFLPSDSSHNETTVASASGDESAHVWRIPSSKKDQDNEKENIDEHTDGYHLKIPLLRLNGHTAPVTAVDWMVGGDSIVTASWDRTANIFDTGTGRILNILSGHEQELTYCCTHHSQKLVVTSSKDASFRLWDFREPIQSVGVFQGHQNSVTSVVFSTGDKLISGSDDRTVKIWDLRNMRIALFTISSSSSVNRLSVSKVHNLIAIPLDNGYVRIYDIHGNRLPRLPNRRCHSRIVTSTAWVDDQHLITSSFDKHVTAWKVTVTRD